MNATTQERRAIYARKAEASRERRMRRVRKYWEIIKRANLPFKDGGTVWIFCAPGRPAAKFYPVSREWKVDQKWYRGGATAFLRWYGKEVRP